MERTDMGLEYWATLAEMADEPMKAEELRRAAAAVDLLEELTNYLLRYYDKDFFDSETQCILLSCVELLDN